MNEKKTRIQSLFKKDTTKTSAGKNGKQQPKNETVSDQDLEKYYSNSSVTSEDETSKNGSVSLEGNKTGIFADLTEIPKHKRSTKNLKTPNMASAAPTATLAEQLKDFITENRDVGAISIDVINKINTAKADFIIAPDELVDVKRLPTAVVDLDTFLAHMTSIKAKLNARDEKIKMSEWDVAKSGQLKMYKLSICCIHAL